MKTLLFDHPKFHVGDNVTVRRGLKWASSIPNELLTIPDAGEVVVRDIRITTFGRLTDYDVANEHDPSCRTVQGLYREMQRVYPGFGDCEVVTILTFEPQFSTDGNN